ncbi:MAG: hypothetical protein PHY30_01180 [Candidatus Pacebacteria bacterium]|nr:hypothetical protein [Candidatus Paceibacterota bacterium]
MEKNIQEINKKFAIIHWEDSWTHGNLQLTEEDWKGKNIGYAVSAGLIVNEDEKQISLATDYFYPQDVDEEGTFRMVNSFPKSGIHKIIRYEVPIEIKNQIIKYYKCPKGEIEQENK